MDFNLEKAIPVLSRTPAVLNDWLKDLPTGWVHQNEGPDSWSPFDIVGHLIHGEKTDWIPRVKIILSDQANKTFEPFDRFAQFNNSRGKSIDELLTEFETLRRENIQTLQAFSLTDDQLSLTGIHPDFGEVTLKELLATWVVHDQSHIAQIARVMAKQYRQEVGPWNAYIPLLNR